MIKTTLTTLAFVTGLASLRADEPAVETYELTADNWQALHAELQPGDEPWRTIPWKIALLDAQHAAAEEKKPLFIWAMDGHPLGCT